MKPFNLYLVFLFFVGFNGLAQSIETYNFENVNQEEGLSQGTVYSTTQYNNFLWFATQDGLNRFDGYAFKVYRTGKKNAINNNFVQALLTDARGQLWVGTTGGLNIHNKSADNFWNFNSFTHLNHLLNSASIEKLTEDRWGNIWIMTDEKGLFRYNPKKNKLTTFFANDNTFYDFCLAPNGSFWVVKYREIYKLNEQSDTFEPLQIEATLKLPPNHLIQAIIPDLENNLWISVYQKGVYVLKNNRNYKEFTLYKKGTDPQNISDDEIRSMLRAKDGKIWLGTKQGGLSIYNPVSKEFTKLKNKIGNKRSIGEDFVISIFQDKQSIIWLGLGSNGFSKYDPSKYPFNLILHENEDPNKTINDDLIFCIYGDEDGLYFGSHQGGFNTYSYQTKLFKNYAKDKNNPQSIIHNEVYGISAEGKKYLWLATTRGLCRFDKASKTFQPFINKNQPGPYYIYSVLKTSFNQIWSGGQSGLDRLDLKTLKWIPKTQNNALSAISNFVIRLFYEDSKKNIWLGTIGHSLIKYNPTTKQVNIFDPKKGLNCNNIRSILEDGQNLWIGTDCGLFIMDLTTEKIIKHFTINSENVAFQLPNDVIYGILKDENNNFWLSSNLGLSQFSLSKGIIKNFDLKDGLQSNEFNTSCTFKRNDGTLFFGGVKGANYFTPKSIGKNEFVPEINITQIKVMDTYFNTNSKKIDLKYDENFMEFEFAASNFSNSQKNKYQYKLVGIDLDWSKPDYKHTANYTKLAPGQYTFLVKASNNDNVWNPKPYSIAINIIPPYWGYWWFLPLMGVLLFSILATAYYLFVSYDLRNKLRNQQIRNDIANDLHDDIGGTLSSISYFGEIAKKRLKAQTPNDEVEKVLDKIINNSQEMIGSMRGVVWAIKPENDLAEEFFDKLNVFVRDILDARGIVYHFEENETLNKIKLSVLQRRNLFLIIKECTHNIAKHSRASEAKIVILVEHNALDLQIIDNGQGFDIALKPTGNGLNSLSERVKSLRGTIKIDAAPNQGTKIHIQFSV